MKVSTAAGAAFTAKEELLSRFIENAWLGINNTDIIKYKALSIILKSFAWLNEVKTIILTQSYNYPDSLAYLSLLVVFHH